MTYLRLEVVGPRRVTVVGDVDLVGDGVEPRVATVLRRLESRLTASPAVARAHLGLSAPEDRDLIP